MHTFIRDLHQSEMHADIISCWHTGFIESNEEPKTQIWELLYSDGKWEKKEQKQQVPILGLEKVIYQRD